MAESSVTHSPLAPAAAPGAERAAKSSGASRAADETGLCSQVLNAMPNIVLVRDAGGAIKFINDAGRAALRVPTGVVPATQARRDCTPANAARSRPTPFSLRQVRRRHPLSETQAWPGFADGDDVPGLGPRFDAFDDDAMEADLPGSRAQQLPLAIDKLPPASQVARRAIASRHRLGLRAPTSHVTHACLPHL